MYRMLQVEEVSLRSFAHRFMRGKEPGEYLQMPDRHAGIVAQSVDCHLRKLKQAIPPCPRSSVLRTACTQNWAPEDRRCQPYVPTVREVPAATADGTGVEKRKITSIAGQP